MKILTASALIGVALVLSACGDDPQVVTDRANREFRDALPDGCTIKYLGKLDRGNTMNAIPMVAVICEGRKTTTTSYLYTSGKHTYPAATIAIGD